MDKYRKAKCIELHDSNNVFYSSQVKRYHEGLTGILEDSRRKSYSIDIRDLDFLRQFVDQNINESINRKESSKKAYGEISIYKEYFEENGCEQEEELEIECQVVSDQLVNIRISTHVSAIDKIYIENISYSGSFTIWWDEEELYE